MSHNMIQSTSIFWEDYLAPREQVLDNSSVTIQFVVIENTLINIQVNMSYKF